MFKKIMSFVLILTIIFSVNINIFANENQGITYEEFKKAQDDGYIGKEITYEEWNNIILLNNQLEESLENDDNFTKIYDSSNYRTKSIPILEKGDILITNGTSALGLTGHAGIATGSDTILHSPGKDDKPVIKNDTREKFYDRYITRAPHNSWIKIYRPKNSQYGREAANWAFSKYYGNNSVRYEINTDLTGFDTIYCSKLIWQAYRYGAHVKDAFHDRFTQHDMQYIGSYYDYNGIVMPYELYKIIKVTYEGKIN